MYSKAVCEAFVCKFAFGRFMSAEEFIVGLLTNFVATPDLTELLRIASNLSAEQVTISDDDGVSQKVTMRKGVILKGSSVVRPAWSWRRSGRFRKSSSPSAHSSSACAVAMPLRRPRAPCSRPTAGAGKRKP